MNVNNSKSKSRKKNIQLILTVLFAIILLSACKKAETDAGQVFYDNGIEIVEKMAEMVNNEEYISYYTYSSQLKELVNKIAEGNYDLPKNVYKITLLPGFFQEMADSYDMNIDGISESLQEDLEKKMISSIGSFVNGISGTEAVAVSSIVSAGGCFVCDGVTEHLIYIYIFEGGYPVFVSFNPGKDGAVSASGSFILNDKFKDMNEDIIKELMENMLMITQYEVEKVQ